jgi:hypothetical protein
VTHWADASVVADEVLAVTNSTTLVATVINIATNFLTIDNLFFISVMANAVVRIDVGSFDILTLAVCAASMLLASVNITAALVLVSKAEISICETLYFEGCGGIVLTASSESLVAVVHRSLFKVDHLADWCGRLSFGTIA